MPCATEERRAPAGRRRPPRRRKPRPRRRNRGAHQGWLRKDLDRRAQQKQARRERSSYEQLEEGTLSLFSRADVDDLARKHGFSRREPRAIGAFEFAMCCAMAAVVEAKRGFATVWRLLGAAAGIKVARSAVTQRFGQASALMMEELFLLASERLPAHRCPKMLSKLKDFRAVLAHDGSVLALSPLLKKLFPSTRTNSVAAAGKVHATADLVRRRIVGVVVTGERESELAVARSEAIEPGTLHLNDLGYFCHDYFAEIVRGGAHLLSRLKSNSAPTIVKVRHGIHAPVRVVQDEVRLNDPNLKFTKCHDTFDIDARFQTKYGPLVLRVVGRLNPETQKYHCYVTDLGVEDFSVEELCSLYCLRWVIELLFKLLKSSCHMDHVDTSDPWAMRTHIYASLLAATILTSICNDAAIVHGMPLAEISALTVGIAAPMFVLPLMLLWLKTKLTREELGGALLRVVAIGCRDQNRARTQAKWGVLGA